MFIIIPLGVAILAGVIYLAVSKKSSFILRIAALGALALMILTVIVCLFIIFGGDSASDRLPLPDALPTETPPPAEEPNVMAVIMIVVFLLVLFILVLIVSLREQKKTANAKKNNAAGW